MLSEREWNIFNNILLELYQIDLASELFTRVMELAHQLIQYTKGYFILIDEKGDINKDYHYFEGMDNLKSMSYINHYYKEDYLQYIYEATVETRVYKDSDLFNDERRVNTEFYKNFLKTENIPYGCGILIVNNGRVIGVFNLFKSYELGDFSEKDTYVLELLKKHIENMVLRVLHTSMLRQDYDIIMEKVAQKYLLTKREAEIIRLLCEGFSNTQICECLTISLSTVKTHIYNVYNKIGVKSRTQLINKIYEG